MKRKLPHIFFFDTFTAPKKSHASPSSRSAFLSDWDRQLLTLTRTLTHTHIHSHSHTHSALSCDALKIEAAFQLQRQRELLLSPPLSHALTHSTPLSFSLSLPLSLSLISVSLAHTCPRCLLLLPAWRALILFSASFHTHTLAHTHTHMTLCMYIILFYSPPPYPAHWQRLASGFAYQS